jgi:adenine-specific DNA-methyltransferase
MTDIRRTAARYAPAVRYMGAKISLRPYILSQVLGPRKSPEAVTDLFAGTATVASWMADGPAVTACDLLHSANVFARVRLLPWKFDQDDISRILANAMAYRDVELQRVRSLIAEEERALEGGPSKTEALIANAAHVGNCDRAAEEARHLRSECGYGLARLYFARGYFSTRQAVELDCLYRAISEAAEGNVFPLSSDCTVATLADLGLAMYLAIASAISNSPGHTAQFLRARSEAGYLRVKRAWTMDALERGPRMLERLGPVGSLAWRSQNLVRRGDSAQIVERPDFSPVPGSVVYADPPYTKDQYSRMYHVLETLYLYDYPDAVGVGRARSDRVPSAFSYRSSALSSLERIARQCATRECPLVLSYPLVGLVDCDELEAMLATYGSVSVTEVDLQHSTLGAARGRASVTAKERLYRLEW